MDDDIDVEEKQDSLFKIALEILAAKCSDLNGKWELAAWVTLNILEDNTKYDSDTYGFVSMHTSTWIIRMIGDAELCSNEHLRIEMIPLIMVITLNEHNKVLAFESILSACTNLDMQFVTESYYGRFSNVDLQSIILIIETINEDGYLTKYDQYFAEKTIKDPKVVNGLTAPIKAIGDYAKIENRDIWEDSLPLKYRRGPDLSFQMTSIMKMLITIFKKSYFLEQLISYTASCTVAVLSFIIWLNLASTSRNLRLDNISIADLEGLLQELGGGATDLLPTPLGRRMIRMNSDYLKSIQGLMKHIAEKVAPSGGPVFSPYRIILELAYTHLYDGTDSDEEYEENEDGSDCDDDECGCICYYKH